LREKRREPAATAAQFVTGNAGMLAKADGRLGRMQQMVRVVAVDHVNVMTLVGQGMAEPVQIHGVAAKAGRRVEGREVQNVEGAVHCHITLCITSIIWRAAASQVRCDAAWAVAWLMRARSSGEPRILAIAECNAL